MPKAKPREGMDLMKLMAQFGSVERCRQYVEALRFPDGVKCPRCNSEKISRIEKRWQFDCDSCRYQFSPTAGTIFHDTHLPLPKWFAAIYLMCESKKGISANQMKRTLCVSYKTAWYLCHRIREALKETDGGLLSGIVEMDETYVGGRRKHVGKGYRANKTAVMAAIEREGNVRMRVANRPDRPTVRQFIKDYIADEASAIFTDESGIYPGIADENTRHETVNHKAEEWVRGEVHTNTIEGVFSLFKRSIVGAFHQVSKKHLDRYLDELEFRFNNRKNPYLFRDALLRLLSSPNLPFETLVNPRQSTCPAVST